MIIALRLTTSVTNSHSKYHFLATCLTPVDIKKLREPKIGYEVGKSSLIGRNCFQARFSKTELTKGDLLICNLMKNGNLQYVPERVQKEYFNNNLELFI